MLEPSGLDRNRAASEKEQQEVLMIYHALLIGLRYLQSSHRGRWAQSSLGVRVGTETLELIRADP